MQIERFEFIRKLFHLFVERNIIISKCAALFLTMKMNISNRQWSDMRITCDGIIASMVKGYYYYHFHCNASAPLPLQHPQQWNDSSNIHVSITTLSGCQCSQSANSFRSPMLPMILTQFMCRRNRIKRPIPTSLHIAHWRLANMSVSAEHEPPDISIECNNFSCIFFSLFTNGSLHRQQPYTNQSKPM